MRLEDVLLQQSGVVSRDQAIACGVSARAMRGRLARGLVTEIHPGVYRSSAHPPDDTQRVWAASLWGGARGVVDGPAAAFWYGVLDRIPAGSPVGVTVPQAVRRRVPDGVRLRRRDLGPRDLARVRGVGVTGLALTALETAVALPDGVALLDRVLQRRLPFAELYAAYCRSVGSPGMSRARFLLVEVADRADSRAERRLIGLLRRAGLDGFERAVPFGRWTIDLAFPRHRVAIEFDGWAFHSGPDRFQNDRTKGNALVAAGWTVLRFTWR
ncbi:MAG: type IV toxin-antitoxin system AbiEi family antitoxin domain-containing protein, partial [Pseudonocardia sediminis]